MKIKSILTKSSLIYILLILPIYYLTSTSFANNGYILRDWVNNTFLLLFVVCVMALQFIFMSKVIKSFKNANTIVEIFLILFTMAITILLLFISFLVFIFSNSEVRVEIVNGEKYIAVDNNWFDPDVPNDYYEYVNIFMYRDILIEENHNIIEVHMDKRDDINENIDEIPQEIITSIDKNSNNVDSIMKLGDDIYGLALMDRAMNRYKYAFVKENVESDNWDIIYEFPVHGEIYNLIFIDSSIGIVNFSDDSLSLYVTKDSGHNWEKLYIDENHDYLYVLDLTFADGIYYLSLGHPKWVKSNDKITYLSFDLIDWSIGTK